MKNTNDDFRLDSEELALVCKKRPQTQLSFAIMLKFFQFENSYPNNVQSLSAEMINILAHQLRVSEQSIRNFQWDGRSSERFRNEIREFLGFRKTVVTDSESLIQWFIQSHLPDVPSLTQCRELAKQYFRQQKIEPFAPKELDRHLRSALAKFEKDLFIEICNELPELTLQQFNELISEENDEDSSPEDDLKK